MAEGKAGTGRCLPVLLVGLAACGMTPFVHGALKRAQKIGAATIFVTCAPEAVEHIPAEIIINPVVGPEVVTGSTRMKAGTATKLVLNTITTGAMVRLGKVFGNLMVDLQVTCDKLRDRGERILMEMRGLQREDAAVLLERAGGHVKTALVMDQLGVDAGVARRRLEEAEGVVFRAVEPGV